MSRVFLGKDTETGRWFESGDMGTFTSSYAAGSIMVVSEDGTMVPLLGTMEGQMLVWDAAEETWAVSAESVSTNRRLLEEILVVLLEIRDRAPSPWFVQKIRDLQLVLEEQVQ